MQIYEEILRLDRSFNVFLIFCGGSGIFDDNGGGLYFFNYGFLNDNTDNNDNGKNGRNCGCHKVTYNTDNGITSATENVVIVVFVVF